MKFFVPFTTDRRQSESLYATIAQSTGIMTLPAISRRIFALLLHTGTECVQCAVGDRYPGDGGRNGDIVLAIFDIGTIYVVCTRTGSAAHLCTPTFASKRNGSPVYFETDDDHPLYARFIETGAEPDRWYSETGLPCTA